VSCEGLTLAFLDKKDIKQLYNDSKTEAHIWREDYTSFERLADNGLMDGLDPNLPEVNDGSLAAALFKLPKRIVSSKLSGTVKAIDRDEAWLSELANLIWQNEIIPNANTQAPFIRKWKDAVRKAAIYGSVPLITIFVEKDGKRHADFIVGQPQDVTLEPGKVSDYDSDVQFWDIYYTKLQLENMIEQAKAEQVDKEKKDNDADEYNKWDIKALEDILASGDVEERSSLDTPRQEQTKNVKPKGFRFCIAVQRGVEAPFYMYHKDTDKTVREWSNPDPSGDVNIHFLYCYQDFINPYGIGIVKLAGGTQNVLDYMRQADVLATQLGLRPPIAIEGDADSADLDSLVYSQDALWFTGNAKVQRQELANGVYQQLPERMAMYKTSLNQLIPTGDTSIASGSGDPSYSKTPAGVKFQGAQLSIDDDDFKDNLYITYAAVAKSMINTHFANMEGSDLMKLSDDERELLIKAGLEFPQTPDGEMSNSVELEWDTMRAQFDFEVDPEVDKSKDDATKLEGLTKVAELSASDPTFAQDLAAVNKKFNKGELYADMVSLTTDNDKIITDIGPEDEMGNGQIDPNTGQPMQGQAPQGAQGQQGPAPQMPKMPSESLNYKDAPEDIKRQIEAQAGLTPSQMTSPGQQQLDQAAQAQQHGQTMDVVGATQAQQAQGHSQNMDMVNASQQQTQPGETQQASTQPQPTPQEMQANVQAVMKQYGVDEHTALAALAAEHAGFKPQDVINHLKQGTK
jgi:hypothetical protein